MPRRPQSGTLIASAVLLACLALTGQSRAQVGHSPAVVSATQSKSMFGQDLTSLIARVHWILITDAGRADGSPLSRFPLSPDVAIADTAPRGRASSGTAIAIEPYRPGRYSNRPWMRTSRAWAS